MDVKNRVFIILSTLIMAVATNSCLAQGSIFEIQKPQGKFFIGGNVSLDSLTRFVNKRVGIKFAFNSIKVKGSKIIYFKKRNYSLLEILQEIKLTTSLYYSFFSGYVIFQDNPPKQLNKSTVTKKITHPTKERMIIHNKTNDSARKNNDSMPIVVVFSKENINNSNINMDSNNWAYNKTIETQAEIGYIEKKTADNINKKKETIEKKLVDSTFKTTTSIKQNNRNPIFRYGLYWNVNFPFSGVKEYFTSTTSTNQFYNTFIPGVWISKKTGKKNNELLFQIKSSEQYFTRNQLIEATKVVALPPLDTGFVTTNMFVVKTNTISTGIQYNYSLSSKLYIGVGVSNIWQQSALVNKQSTHSKTGLISDTLYGMNTSSINWRYLKPSFVAGNLEFFYSFSNITIGSAFYIPLTSVFIDSPGAARSINGHLFLRWKLK